MAAGESEGVLLVVVVGIVVVEVVVFMLGGFDVCDKGLSVVQITVGAQRGQSSRKCSPQQSGQFDSVQNHSRCQRASTHSHIPTLPAFSSSSLLERSSTD